MHGARRIYRHHMNPARRVSAKCAGGSGTQHRLTTVRGALASSRHGTRAPYLQLDLSGDLVLAGYYLMAYWPNPETLPDFCQHNGDLEISTGTEHGEIADIRNTLQAAVAEGGAVARSAAAFLELLSDSAA
jgi:hypothetical protein